MIKSRFSETQIIAILKEAGAGMKIDELCRKHGISDATYYKWKSKYGGMEASDLKRVRELEAENAKLKRMYADLGLENTAMKDLIAKNSRAEREAGVSALAGAHAPAVDCAGMPLSGAVSFGLVPGTGALDGT